MPAPAETLVKPQDSTIEVSVEPVHNALQSLMIIQKAEHLSGLNDWVQITREAMTPAERENNRLVIEGLHYALYPQRQWSSFPDYIDHLESPDKLRKLIPEEAGL